MAYHTHACCHNITPLTERTAAAAFSVNTSLQRGGATAHETGEWPRSALMRRLSYLMRDRKAAFMALSVGVLRPTWSDLARRGAFLCEMPQESWEIYTLGLGCTGVPYK